MWALEEEEEEKRREEGGESFPPFGIGEREKGIRTIVFGERERRR